MKNTKVSRPQSAFAFTCAAFAVLMLMSSGARAATWKGLEPFVSKRAEVERVFGPPVSDRLAKDGTLEFDTPDGTVMVFFVTPKFVAAKKLPAALEGTVLQIIVQHVSSKDTPESLSLAKNSAYKRRRDKKMDVYSNTKEGIYYTFVDSRLKTTRYSYAFDRLVRIVRGK